MCCRTLLSMTCASDKCCVRKCCVLCVYLHGLLAQRSAIRLRHIHPALASASDLILAVFAPWRRLLLLLLLLRSSVIRRLAPITQRARNANGG